MSRPVLVTGASGFIGTAVARRLQAAGYHVRVFARPTSRRDNLDDLDADIVTGDLRDRDSLSRALAGCRGLFHVAADYRLWAPQPRELYANNVDGTRNVLSAAAACGIHRIVYTSSVATLGLHADSTPADEDTPTSIEAMIGHYKRSKYLAEQGAREVAAACGLDLITVHPSAPVGPRDIKPTPTGRIILNAVRARMPAYVDTGLNIVHVDDVAHGHVLAWEHGAAGRHYILGGENMSLQAILATVAECAGTRPPRLRLRHGLVLPVARAAEAWARISGRAPLVTVDGVRLARQRMYFSHARATAELGYAPRPARAALADAVAWFRQRYS